MQKTNAEKKPFDFEELAKNISAAREVSGISIKEASQLLGIPSSRLRNYESGKYIPSLPEMEALSFLYHIPVTALFHEEMVDRYLFSPEGEQIQHLIQIRQQIIGTRLRLTREAADASLKHISRITSIPTSRIKRYEEGASPISFDDLEKLTTVFELDIRDFFDLDSPLGEWQNLQEQKIIFEDLPKDIRAFVTNADNRGYLDIAKNLSTIGKEALLDLSKSLASLIDSFKKEDNSNHRLDP